MGPVRRRVRDLPEHLVRHEQVDVPEDVGHDVRPVRFDIQLVRHRSVVRGIHAARIALGRTEPVHDVPENVRVKYSVKY